MMRSLACVFGLPLLALLAGCGTPPEQRLETPGLQVTGMSEAARGYELTLRVINPNTVPVAVIRSVHHLYLGEEQIGRIDDPEPIGVPPLGEVTHSLVLPEKLSAAVRAWLKSHPGSVRVSTQSTLEIAVGTENETIKLTSTGRGLVAVP